MSETLLVCFFFYITEIDIIFKMLLAVMKLAT